MLKKKIEKGMFLEKSGPFLSIKWLKSACFITSLFKPGEYCSPALHIKTITYFTCTFCMYILHVHLNCNLNKIKIHIINTYHCERRFNGRIHSLKFSRSNFYLSYDICTRVRCIWLWRREFPCWRVTTSIFCEVVSVKITKVTSAINSKMTMPLIDLNCLTISLLSVRREQISNIHYHACSSNNLYILKWHRHTYI